jgi:hypothetical protein
MRERLLSGLQDPVARPATDFEQQICARRQEQEHAKSSKFGLEAMARMAGSAQKVQATL